MERHLPWLVAALRGIAKDHGKEAVEKLMNFPKGPRTQIKGL